MCIRVCVCQLLTNRLPLQRSITALSDYVKGQLADPVKEYTGGDAMGKLVCDMVRCSYRKQFHMYNPQCNVTHSCILCRK